ncbi:Signal transduction histidine kinase [Selenomonas ruminantium]|uniref:Circadian input-output histidine kinase CikA n=1 Tax=Selenomonas ruminantium TaxID=971 RepID=A0A1M6UAW0_SELRU|nr:ATP-binding protein [Selenomonas ruminantium]SHK66372.1 Signal transduction histidine kinase [Selenomonas ruminantium]
MNNRKKMLLTILTMLFLIFLSGIFIQQRIVDMLNKAAEHSVARQTEDLSLLAGERFRRFLTPLQTASKHLSEHEEDKEDMLKMLAQQNPQGQAGLIDFQHHTLGRSVSSTSFPRLQLAFHGNTVIDYNPDIGILLATPVIYGDNVRYVLYQIYPISMLPQLFALSDYDAFTHVIIQYHDGTLAVPYENYTTEDTKFWADDTIQKGMQEVHHRLERNKAAAVYTEGAEGKFFVFGADLPQTDFSLIGYMPWSAVAGQIISIYQRVVFLFTLMLVLFACLSIYLLMAQTSVAETEELRQARLAADTANQAKSQFLANMSHEIRTPLNAISGMNEMILRQELPGEVRQYASNIKSATAALLTIINEILDFSKIESGHMEIVPTDYQLTQVLREVCALVGVRAQAKNLTFKIHVDPYLPNGLYGDTGRLRQILINLLNNAIKYTPSGSITLDISGQRKDSTLYLQAAVTDTGIGIREEDKERLFHVFERLDIKRNCQIEGTGLGLAITHRLLNMMKGSIKVDSTYGEGSVFTIKLPQEIHSFDPVGVFSLNAQPDLDTNLRHQAGFIAPDAQVLIVDDNDMNCFVAGSLLKETQVQTVIAHSGDEALEALQKQRFHVVLLDYMMPGMDGVETLHKAKQLPNVGSTRFIALTATAISGSREKFLSEGFDNYLSKPMTGDDLTAMLHRYLPPELILQPLLTSSPAPAPVEAKEPASTADTPPAPPLIDHKIGLTYCNNMQAIYDKVLTMFHDQSTDKIAQLDNDLAAANWKNYRINIHALKSTALTIGCRSLNQKAKDQEQAVKDYLAEDATPHQQQQAMDYIQQNHADIMNLYRQVASSAVSQ